MVFNKFKEDVVIEKGWASKKSINKMTIGLALWTILIAFGLSLITACTVGLLITCLVLFLSGLGFVWVFDLADETEDNLKATMKFAKFWWLGIVMDILIFLVLKMFHFL